LRAILRASQHATSKVNVPTAADLPGLDDVRLCGTDPFMAEKFGITGRQGLIEQLRRFVVEGGNIGDRNTAIQMIKNATGLGANPNPVAWADAKPGIYAVFLDNEHVVIGEVLENGSKDLFDSQLGDLLIKNPAINWDSMAAVEFFKFF
jgi:hypothetical protein